METELRDIKIYEKQHVRNESVVQNQALFYFDKGFNVIPLRYRTKVPAMKWENQINYRLPRYAVEHEFPKNNVGIIVGKTSLCLFVIDCDSQAAYQQMLHKLEKVQLAKWYHPTSRGGHFWFISQDGEVQNHKDGDIEVIGSKHYVMSPPSTNGETGLVYEWEKMEGDLPPILDSIQIHGLFGRAININSRMVNGLPPTAYRVLVLRDISKYESNSEAEFGATLSLVRCGYDDEQIKRIFNEYEPPHYSRKNFDEVWLLENYIKPAREEINTPPFQKKIDKLVSWAIQRNWEGRTGATDKLVFLACCQRARVQGFSQFRASQREISDLTNITDEPVRKSLRRLVEKNEYLSFTNKDGGMGNYFTFTQLVQDLSNEVSICNINEEYLTNILNHDVWHPSALGKSALNLYIALRLSNNGETEEGMETILGKKSKTIKRATEKLANEGLIAEFESTWKAYPISVEFLDEIAERMGTLGRNAQRIIQHRVEREDYYYRLAVQKRSTR